MRHESSNIQHHTPRAVYPLTYWAIIGHLRRLNQDHIRETPEVLSANLHTLALEINVANSSKSTIFLTGIADAVLT